MRRDTAHFERSAPVFEILYRKISKNIYLLKEHLRLLFKSPILIHHMHKKLKMQLATIDRDRHTNWTHYSTYCKHGAIRAKGAFDSRVPHLLLLYVSEFHFSSIFYALRPLGIIYYFRSPIPGKLALNVWFALRAEKICEIFCIATAKYILLNFYPIVCVKSVSRVQ